MSVTYDENIIATFADRLYARAALAVVQYVALGAAMGAAVAIVTSLPWPVGAGIGALLGGFFGNDRAFTLRLIAQTALCQAQIERNTRPTTAAAPVLSSENPLRVVNGSSESPALALDGAVQSDAEAKLLVKRAQDHHFAKDFPQAIAIYEEVITRFPDSKQASAARTQIKNLR